MRRNNSSVVLFFPLCKMHLQMISPWEITEFWEIFNVFQHFFHYQCLSSRFWNAENFHHQIQPEMCPVSCTQLCTKSESPLTTVCPCQSQAMLYVRSLHCTHLAGRNVQFWSVTFVMNRLSPLDLSVASWPKASASLQKESSCPLVTPIPGHIHRPSDKTCDTRCLIPVVNGVKYSDLFCPPMLSNVKCNDPWVYMLLFLHSLDIIKCQRVSEPSLFIFLGNVVEWQRQQEIHLKQTDIFFKICRGIQGNWTGSRQSTSRGSCVYQLQKNLSQSSDVSSVSMSLVLPLVHCDLDG